MTPQMQRVLGGWQAHGEDFAVFGRTEDEARGRFQDAQRRHAEILNRPYPAQPSPTGPQLPSSRSPIASRG